MAFGGLVNSRGGIAERWVSRSKDQRDSPSSMALAQHQADLEKQEIDEMYSNDKNLEGGKRARQRDDTISNSPEDEGTRIKNVDLEDAKNVIASPQSVSRLIYFASITFFTGMLSTRPYSDKNTPPVTAKMESYIIAEMVLAFFFVSFSQYSVFVDFVETIPTASRVRIAKPYAWIAPTALWLFTSIWSIIYTMHIPMAFQHVWQWGITSLCILVNLGILSLVLQKHLISGRMIVEQDKEIKYAPTDLPFPNHTGKRITSGGWNGWKIDHLFTRNTAH